MRRQQSSVQALLRFSFWLAHFAVVGGPVEADALRRLFGRLGSLDRVRVERSLEQLVVVFGCAPSHRAVAVQPRPVDPHHLVVLEPSLAQDLVEDPNANPVLEAAVRRPRMADPVVFGAFHCVPV